MSLFGFLVTLFCLVILAIIVFYVVQCCTDPDSMEPQFYKLK